MDSARAANDYADFEVNAQRLISILKEARREFEELCKETCIPRLFPLRHLDMGWDMQLFTDLHEFVRKLAKALGDEIPLDILTILQEVDSLAYSVKYQFLRVKGTGSSFKLPKNDVQPAEAPAIQPGIARVFKAGPTTAAPTSSPFTPPRNKTDPSGDIDMPLAPSKPPVTLAGPFASPSNSFTPQASTEFVDHDVDMTPAPPITSAFQPDQASTAQPSAPFAPQLGNVVSSDDTDMSPPPLFMPSALKKINSSTYLSRCQKKSAQIIEKLQDSRQRAMIPNDFKDILIGIDNVLNHYGSGSWDADFAIIFEKCQAWVQCMVDLRRDILAIKCPATQERTGPFYEFRKKLKMIKDLFPAVQPTPRAPTVAPKPVSNQVKATAIPFNTVSGSLDMANAYMSSSGSFNAGSSFGTQAGFASSASSVPMPDVQISVPEIVVTDASSAAPVAVDAGVNDKLVVDTAMSAPEPVETVAASTIPVPVDAGVNDKPVVDTEMSSSGTVDAGAPASAPTDVNGSSDNAQATDQDKSAPDVIDAGASSSTPVDVAGTLAVVPVAAADASSSSAPVATKKVVLATTELFKTVDVAALTKLFDDIGSLKALVAALKNVDLLEALKEERQEIVRHIEHDIEIKVRIFPLIKASVLSVWNAHDDLDGFNGPAIAAKAKKWYKFMCNIEGILNIDHTKQALAKSIDFGVFQTDFKDAMAYLKKGASAPLPESKGKKYRSKDVPNATKEDILTGAGAFAIENLYTENYLRALFAHDVFRRELFLAHDAIPHIVNSTARVTAQDIELLRRGCDYILKTARDNLTTTLELNNMNGIGKFREKMADLRLTLCKLPEGEEYDPALELIQCIREMQDVFDGKHDTDTRPARKIIASTSRRRGAMEGVKTD